MIGPADAGARAHAFVADLEAPELNADDRHHFDRVLRLRAGEPITVADGRGRWRRATYGAVIEPVDAIELQGVPSPSITVGFALVKGDRPEWIVQKLTELGVDTIVPIAAARCVVHWEGDKARHHVERLRRVARGAAMQSRRAWLPLVEEVTQLDHAVQREGAVLADRTGGVPSLRQAFVVVGPEGGWTDEERKLATTVSFGPEVLRVETAAITAGALLTALRGGVVLSPGQ